MKHGAEHKEELVPTLRALSIHPYWCPQEKLQEGQEAGKSLSPGWHEGGRGQMPAGKAIKLHPDSDPLWTKALGGWGKVSKPVAPGFGEDERINLLPWERGRKQSWAQDPVPTKLEVTNH